jgi:hypothetical protein
MPIPGADGPLAYISEEGINKIKKQVVKNLTVHCHVERLRPKSIHLSGRVAQNSNCMRLYYNSFAYGASKIFGSYTSQRCRDACAKDSSCKAVDWISGQCWIHNNLPRGLKSKSGAAHYTKFGSCTPSFCKSQLSYYMVHRLAARRRQLWYWPPFSLPDISSPLQLWWRRHVGWYSRRRMNPESSSSVSIVIGSTHLQTGSGALGYQTSFHRAAWHVIKPLSQGREIWTFSGRNFFSYKHFWMSSTKMSSTK